MQAQHIAPGRDVRRRRRERDADFVAREVEFQLLGLVRT